jgi:Arc/MetJ family transcription regulator
VVRTRIVANFGGLRQTVNVKRTTIAIDEELLARAKRALGETTTKATVEEGLRLLVETVESERTLQHRWHLRYYEQLDVRAELDVLSAGEMWR